jgi:hypothetical protein
MTGNLFSFSNTWGSGGANGWINNSATAQGHYGGVRAEYCGKSLSPTYPQISSSLIKSPITLTPNAVNSYPNPIPYTIQPSTNYSYQFGSNPTYAVSNTCDIGGF